MGRPGCAASPAAKAPSWAGFHWVSKAQGAGRKAWELPRPRVGMTFAIATHSRLLCAESVSVRRERGSSLAGCVVWSATKWFAPVCVMMGRRECVRRVFGLYSSSRIARGPRCLRTLPVQAKTRRRSTEGLGGELVLTASRQPRVGTIAWHAWPTQGPWETLA